MQVGRPRRPRVTRAPFGTTRDGVEVDAFTLTNVRGLEVRVITYGAIIVALRVPDRAGRLDDVVLGFDNLDGYLNDSPYFGAIVGRYSNRIANSRFTLGGTTYRLTANDGAHHLHGGVRGFDKVLWRGAPFDRRGVGVVLTYTSPDGEEGYPGTLEARVTYTLTNANELIVDYHATTDRPTHLNLSQHTYFNLTGGAKRDVLDHRLTLYASRFTPVDVTLIPTGELAAVEGTPFDFRDGTAIGARIDHPHEQLRNGRGYDHNYVLDRNDDGTLALAARVTEPGSGRVLHVFTTEPGVQFYSGNFLGQVGAGIRGKSGRTYGARFGFCLETQHFPDSPNNPSFPPTVLRPGRAYQSRTVFAFSTT